VAGRLAVEGDFFVKRLNFSTVAVAALAAVPLAASAQATTDYVGRPFALWFFLLIGAGILAVIAAYMAKAAVEKK
jgi:hypothetical protein